MIAVARLPLTLVLAVLASALAVHGPAPAQAPHVPSLAEVLRDADHDRVPDRVGDTVSVVAVATTETRRIGEHAWVLHAQDASAGVTLFTRDSTVLPGISPGDTIRVRGVVQQFRGAEQLQPLRVRRLGSGPVPEPVYALAADLVGERLSGRLVHVSGELRVTHRPGEAPEVRLRDHSGEIPVYLRSAELGDPAFTARLLRGGRAEVVGIAYQSDETPPYDSGYELLPRGRDDFDLSPLPPYRLLAFLAVISALAILAGFLAVRRRSAERRVREMAALAEDLRRSEQALQLQTAHLEQLFRGAPEGIALLDSDDRVIRVNPEFLRLFGYSMDEVLGRTINELIVPEDRKAEAAALTRNAAEGGRIAVETVRQRKNGMPVHVSILATPIHLEEKAVAVYGIYRDITERKEAEEALAKSEAQLRQSQKMEAVGRLAGGVAHDFNNLLTAIRGNADLLLLDLPETDPLRLEVEEIRYAAERAAGLTRQLLAFSRKQVLRPAVLDLNSAVVEAAGMLRRLIGADVELRTVLDPGLGKVKADPAQVNQVIVNLVVNARDAMPGGGRLTVETRDVLLDGESVGIRPEVSPGPYVMLSVTDTGEGMDPEVQKKVFEPFFTTKETGKGTGLGLSTVYGIVQQSGGYVSVYSEPGEGSTFRVYLPRVEEAAGAETAAAPPRASTTGSERVLLVEDEEQVRELARRILTRNGYSVLVARDGEEAAHVSREYEGEIDLLLTDVVMPRMSGPALAEQLRGERAGMRVLFMSGYTRDALGPGRLGPAAADLVLKPFAAEDLVRRVRGALDGGVGAPEA